MTEHDPMDPTEEPTTETPEEATAACDRDLPTLLAELSDTYDRREEHKRQLDEASARFSEIEDQIARLMVATGTESLQHDRWTLAPKHTVSWKVPSSAKDRVLQLVKQGAPELVKETVNHMSLNGFLRKEEERLELERPAWWADLEPLLERAESLTLSLRKR
ncbi:MAG TPA: hypothetical protein VMV46_17630 [Thermoanaerobaculia bacterium]|nr:hypothetical protein [Thermoanaerobaculia bacterium]